MRYAAKKEKGGGKEGGREGAMLIVIFLRRPMAAVATYPYD